MTETIRQELFALIAQQRERNRELLEVVKKTVKPLFDLRDELQQSDETLDLIERALKEDADTIPPPEGSA
jgi:hypothetical protein